MTKPVRIKPLSLQLANQIAAGEVVERPASVVKELLENAIDAQSQQIHIEIEQGGGGLIRISDDGVGIDKDDLSLAVTRHATSKIHSLSELEKIISLGFRGEALASISAVSKLSIKSKTAEQSQAWLIDTGTDNDFADYTAIAEPAAAPQTQGTIIEVRDLFYNTPARRKFMRTVKTEFRHIDDIVKRIALSQFDIAFKLSHNKKLLRHLPRAVTEKAISQRIGKLFSSEFLSHSNKVDFSSDHFKNMGTLRLWGWISAPQWHRKQADWQYFYVNGRYIKDKLVNHALRQAYQELLPEETFSAYLLYLEIDPQQVDVNVHPTKHEVRFRESRLIHDFIYSALKQALEQSELPEAAAVQSDVSPLGHMPSDNIPATDMQYVNHYSRNSSYQPQTHSSVNQHKVAEQISSLQQLYNPLPQVDKDDASESPPAVKKSVNHFGNSLGCLVPGYLLSQRLSDSQPVQIFVIHILRAQQYLLQQKFKAGQQTPLLIPQSITLPAADIDSILSQQPALQQWGLDLNQLADDSLLVRSLPSLYAIPGCHIEVQSLLAGLLSAETETDRLAALMQSLTIEQLTLTEQAELLKLLSEQYECQPSVPQIEQKPVWTVLDETTLAQLF